AAGDIACGAEKLVEIIQTFTRVKQDYLPEILLVSPPVLRSGISRSPFRDSFSEEAVEVSRQLGALYKEAAGRKGCHYLDAARFVASSEEDCLHLTAGEHEKLAAALADCIRNIWKEGEES
ncbi:MAG: acylhydrolase, partial [Eubacterium sp.]|nr:acylhydrolase [Eubacterium sp.]